MNGIEMNPHSLSRKSRLSAAAAPPA